MSESSKILDFIQTTFQANVPYADGEMAYYAQQAGFAFGDIVLYFNYLGRCSAKQNGKLYYWYQLEKGGANA